MQVACVQLDVEGGAVAANVDRAVDRIRAAAADGAD
ncbi:carbon-nitrogen family hydrolase, partial [Halorubrum sp. CBA1125]|nr:carbon-nitrogen family hydrolase [Halorubrum sp. CBA1125]